MLNRLLDVFASFESHDVRYVVIGGVAAILHGVPRATFDLDILIEASSENVRRLLEALTDASMGTATMTSPEEVLENAITIFQDRVRLDVQTTTPGVAFKKAWANRKTMNYQGQSFYVLSKGDLIASKLAAGRDVDLEDARLLQLDEDEDNEKKDV